MEADQRAEVSRNSNGSKELKSESVLSDSSGEVTSAGEERNDPFAYIKEKGFTTEIFKIEIQNLPRKFGIQVSGTHEILEVLSLFCFVFFSCFPHKCTISG